MFYQLLDQNKITNNNKLVPLDWFQTYSPEIVKLELEGGAFGDIPYNRRQYPHMKDEEFCLNAIKNIKSKIIHIEFSDAALTIIKQHPEKFPDLIKYI